MPDNGFWIIYISDDYVQTGYVSSPSSEVKIASFSSRVGYDPQHPDSLIQSADSSLSESGRQANLSKTSEPNSAAFVVSPLWADHDGKIISQKHELLKNICHSLGLKPLGFICADDALVESQNQQDSFPASFILVIGNLANHYLSLAYLGKIIAKIVEPIDTQLTPANLESAILKVKTESALPPSIILAGNIKTDTLEDIKNYKWVGKNTETFLHHPDIVYFDDQELFQSFLTAISLQIGKVVTSISPPAIPATPPPSSSLNEVEPSQLDFTSYTPTPPQQPDPVPSNISVDQPDVLLPPPVHKPKFVLPKIHLPHIKPAIPKISFPLPLLIISLITAIFILFSFSRATVTLYLNPHIVDKTLSVKLTDDSSQSSFDSLSVNQDSLTIVSQRSAASTDTKTVGENAKGDIIIYNKSDKTQNIPKDAILKSPAGLQFKLQNPVAISAGIPDLDAGVITLGQTRGLVIAADIGPEYNLEKNTLLVFKDIPESLSIAKIQAGLSGGTKRVVQVVGRKDIDTLKLELDSVLKAETETKMAELSSSVPGLIAGSVVITDQKPDYSREVGEEAIEVTAVVNRQIEYSYVPDNQKTSFLTNVFTQDPELREFQADFTQFKLAVQPSNGDPSTATVHINGSVLPNVDLEALANKIRGKSKTAVSRILKSEVDRVYNYKIENNFAFLDFINPLPFNPANIKFILSGNSQ